MVELFGGENIYFSLFGWFLEIFIDLDLSSLDIDSYLSIKIYNSNLKS